MTKVDLTAVEEAQIQQSTQTAQPASPSGREAAALGSMPLLIFEEWSQPQVDAAVGKTGWEVGRLPRRSIVFVISAAAVATSIIIYFIYFGMTGLTSREFMPIREAIDEDATAELQQERKKTAALTNELIAARRDYLQTIVALSNNAGDEMAQLRKTAEAATAALDQEQKKTEALTNDLATARRDLETKAALSTKAGDETAQLRKTAEALQQEQDKNEALALDLSTARAKIYYEAQAHKASSEVAALKQAADAAAAELQQEQERTGRLEQDLVAARREVETQAALAAEASAEAARLKQAADENSAESLRLLQQEREKTTRLERELASERKTPKEVPAASGAMTTGRLAQDKQPGADAIRPVAATQTSGAATQSNAKPDPQSAAEMARLMARASALLGQGDIGSARVVLERAAETGNARASFALAETYDPLVLRKWGAYGTLGDAAKARDLYARAQAGGIKEAKERFDALQR